VISTQDILFAQIDLTQQGSELILYFFPKHVLLCPASNCKQKETRYAPEEIAKHTRPLRPPSPSEFPMTLHSGGMDIFWDAHIYASQ